MTLADLKRRTLRHLELPADSDVIPAVDLLDGINTARRDVWRECEGPVGDLITLDLVAGQSVYPLSGHQVESVSNVYALDGDRVSRLCKVSPDTLLSMGLFPVPGVAVPWAWSIAPYAAPAVSLYPAPSASSVAALRVDASGAAADLVLDSDVSPLPTPVDDAACWKAAADLALDFFDDASIAAKAPMLEARAAKAIQKAALYVFDMDGGLDILTPVEGFGYEGRKMLWEPAYQTFGGGGQGTLLAIATGVSAAGQNSITIPLDPPAAAATVPLAFSYTQGYLSDVTLAGDHMSVTVKTDAGIVFVGETVAVYYQREA